MPEISRRNLIAGIAGISGVLAIGGVAAANLPTSAVGPTSDVVRRVEQARRRSGQKLVTARLTPRPVTLDLGGQIVQTWGYGDTAPGPLLRATAGDLLRVDVDNQLPAETSIHWHGIALRNDMDGVPGITQQPIKAGTSHRYEFTVADPGTYFYHPHSGVQLDRGLYGVLVVDDPAEPGDYDKEWIVVLDDWVDGTGRTPEEILKKLLATAGGSKDSGGMDMGPMGGMGSTNGEMQSSILGGAGDITYPYYLINGKPPASPSTLSAKPGERVRIRIINAGSDTAFRVALGGHSMTITHSDGYPVEPLQTDALLIGMGERYDVLVTVQDGVFPLVASAEGKGGRAFAVVRTGSGRAPGPNDQIDELSQPVTVGTDLTAIDAVKLSTRDPDRRHDLLLSGSMAPYRWTLNGKTFPAATPLTVHGGERVRLRFNNMSMMFHPMHVHGHTFALREGGARKDTVIVRPMQSIDVDLDANNPGQWATHCHNIYHAEAGMMTTLSYRD